MNESNIIIQFNPLTSRNFRIFEKYHHWKTNQLFDRFNKNWSKNCIYNITFFLKGLVYSYWMLLSVIEYLCFHSNRTCPLLKKEFFQNNCDFWSLFLLIKLLMIKHIIYIIILLLMSYNYYKIHIISWFLKCRVVNILQRYNNRTTNVQELILPHTDVIWRYNRELFYFNPKFFQWTISFNS